jgi:hypothetical protein
MSINVRHYAKNCKILYVLTNLHFLQFSCFSSCIHFRDNAFHFLPDLIYIRRTSIKPLEVVCEEECFYTVKSFMF